MDVQTVEQYLLAHQKYFPSEKLIFLKERLIELDETKFSNLYAIELKDPLIVLIISIFLGHFGIDRFMLHETARGILKLITFGGFGIWTFIDWILMSDKTKKYNFDKVMDFIAGKYF